MKRCEHGILGCGVCDRKSSVPEVPRPIVVDACKVLAHLDLTPVERAAVLEAVKA